MWKTPWKPMTYDFLKKGPSICWRVFHIYVLCWFTGCSVYRIRNTYFMVMTGNLTIAGGNIMWISCWYDNGLMGQTHPSDHFGVCKHGLWKIRNSVLVKFNISFPLVPCMAKTCKNHSIKQPWLDHMINIIRRYIQIRKPNVEILLNYLIDGLSTKWLSK